MNTITCPQCLSQYVLGLTGTVDGCDVCEGVIRNEVDHTIIEEDSMTDMEKA